MAISPFPARPPAPATPGSERRQARLVTFLVAVGIGFSLLAYAISPTVRHAVGHAAHSVKGAVGHVLDRDKGATPRGKTGGSAAPSTTGGATTPTSPSSRGRATTSTAGGASR